MECGRQILNLRVRQGLSLRELSRLADISPASLSAIEKEQSSPTLATLQKIVKALGTNFSEFFADSSVAVDTPVFPAAGMKRIEDANRTYSLLFPKASYLRFEMIDETISTTDREGEWEDITEWHRVVIFGRQAETCKDYLKKGSKIYLEGRIQTRSWDDKNGQKHYSTEVVGFNFIMLDSRSQDTSQAAQDTREASPPPQSADEGSVPPPQDFPQGDDDLPF